MTKEYRFTLAAITCAWFGFGIAITVLGPTIQPIRESFDLAMGETGLILLVGPPAYMAASLISGRMSDMHGRKLFVIAGLLIMALGSLTLASAPSWPQAILGSAIMSLGFGLLDAPLCALIVDISGDNSSSTMNYTQAGFAAGAVLGPILTGLLLESAANWRLVYTLLALCAAIIAPLFIWAPTPSIGANPTPIPIRQISKILFRPRLFSLSIILALYIGLELNLSLWLPSFMEMTFNSSRDISAWSVSFFWLGSGLGRLIMGYAAKRSDNYYLLSLCMCGGGLACLAISISATAVTALIGTIVAGILIGGVFPIVISLAVSDNRNLAGTITSAMMIVASIAAATVPPAGGPIAELSNMRIVLALGVPLGLVGATIALYAKKHQLN